MKPLKFKEAQVELKKPSSMTDSECSSLWVYRSDKGECISLWTTSFWERLKFLFHGKIWIGILSGPTQPPVWLDCRKTVFVYEKKKKYSSVLKDLIIKIKYIIWALSKINKLHLGDNVKHQGKRYVIVNGASNPIWDLIDKDRQRKRAHELDIQPERSLSQYWHRLKFDYRFQMTSWFSIDQRKPTFAKLSYS